MRGHLFCDYSDEQSGVLYDGDGSGFQAVFVSVGRAGSYVGIPFAGRLYSFLWAAPDAQERKSVEGCGFAATEKDAGRTDR